MKKFISRFLIKMAVLLDENARELLAPVVDGYDAGKVGNTIIITRKDRREYERKYDISCRQSYRDLVKSAKANIRIAVCRKIDEMIEYSVIQGEFGTEVSGHIKVYARKKNDKKV